MTWVGCSHIFNNSDINRSATTFSLPFFLPPLSYLLPSFLPTFLPSFPTLLFLPIFFGATSGSGQEKFLVLSSRVTPGKVLGSVCGVKNLNYSWLAARQVPCPLHSLQPLQSHFSSLASRYQANYLSLVGYFARSGAIMLAGNRVYSQR